MGLIQHHVLVVTVGLEDKIKDLRTFVRANSLPVLESPEVMNGYVTFIMYPDGSKEGWADSDIGDERRRQLIQWINEQSYSDGSNSFAYVEVGFGELELHVSTNR